MARADDLAANGPPSPFRRGRRRAEPPKDSTMIIDHPHLLALLVAHHHERLVEAGTGRRHSERPTPRFRLRRRRRSA
jgi:hypothetical protein